MMYVLTLTFDGCVDVLALSETWLDETVLDAELFPQNCGFSIVHCDRNRQGGGIAFLLANHVHYVLRSDLCTGNIESLWLQLFLGSRQSILVCCAYKPPSCVTFYDHLSEECELFLAGNVQKLCIIGDFNSDLLQPALPLTCKLIQLMKHFNCHELIGKPTRVTDSGCSQTDVFLTNIPNGFCESITVPCACSDHHIIFIDYYARGIKAANDPKIVSFRNYRKLDVNLLSDMLSDGDTWNAVFSFSDVNDCVLCFTLVLQGLIDFLVLLCHLWIREGGWSPWFCASNVVSARHL